MIGDGLGLIGPHFHQKVGPERVVYTELGRWLHSGVIQKIEYLKIYEMFSSSARPGRVLNTAVVHRM